MIAECVQPTRNPHAMIAQNRFMNEALRKATADVDDGILVYNATFVPIGPSADLDEETLVRVVTATASATYTHFEAQSRSLLGFLCTPRSRCRPAPRNTRFRLVDQPWPVGPLTRWVPQKVSVMSLHGFLRHQASGFA